MGSLLVHRHCVLRPRPCRAARRACSSSLSLGEAMLPPDPHPIVGGLKPSSSTICSRRLKPALGQSVTTLKCCSLQRNRRHHQQQSCWSILLQGASSPPWALQAQGASSFNAIVLTTRGRSRPREHRPPSNRRRHPVQAPGASSSNANVLTTAVNRGASSSK